MPFLFRMFAGVATVVGLLVFAFVGFDRWQGLPPKDSMDLGLRTLDPRSLIRRWYIPSNGDYAVVASALVANTPQLILSLLYLVLNGVMTKIALAEEWSHLSTSYRALRVSYARGAQRSTYFLTLPYRVGLPLMVFSTTLHWLASQSIFLAKIDDEKDDSQSLTSCGASVLGMVCFLAVLLMLLAFLASFGMRQIPCTIPIVGSSSLAISSACHTPLGTCTMQPLKWKAVPVEQGENENVIESFALCNPPDGYHHFYIE